MTEPDTVADCERSAEAAYAAMYDARPHGVKDCYDDARLYFSRAIEAASNAGLADEVTRLAKRLEQVEAVYNGQFRGVGR